MKRSVKHFIEICSKTLPIMEPIYEFGSRQMPGQEGYADLRPFFSGKDYIGADYIAGPGVDVVLDLQKIDLPSESVGTVICMEVVEHVAHPFQALREIHRILKPGGIVIMSAPMNLRIHGSPYDYWRFTPQGFETLLEPFDQTFVGSSGADDFPDTVIGIGVKGQNVALDSFETQYASWKHRWTGLSAKLVRSIAPRIKPFTPSILSPDMLELWIRQRGNPGYATWKNFAKLLLPPIVKAVFAKKSSLTE